MNGLRRRGLVAQVGLLHHILSIHRTPEHAVGDGKQVGPVGFKGFHSFPAFRRVMRTDVVPLCVGCSLERLKTSNEHTKGTIPAIRNSSSSCYSLYDHTRVGRSMLGMYRREREAAGVRTHSFSLARRLQKQEDVRYSRQGCLRYFLSNTNTGWLTAARSNSSREESAVTP